MSETPRLSPGDAAPDFTLTDDAGAEVALSSLRGRKVIVYFYPAAMTPGCTKQACDFTDSIESLRGAELDTLWLESMIAHHRGAVEMAKAEIVNGDNDAAKALAGEIIKAQEAEIAQMKQMLEG